VFFFLSLSPAEWVICQQVNPDEFLDFFSAYGVIQVMEEELDDSLFFPKPTVAFSFGTLETYAVPPHWLIKLFQSNLSSIIQTAILRC
jgi:hypothetical protein